MGDNREEERSDFTGRLSRRMRARVVKPAFASNRASITLPPNTWTSSSYDVRKPVWPPGLPCSPTFSKTRLLRFPVRSNRCRRKRKIGTIPMTKWNLREAQKAAMTPPRGERLFLWLLFSSVSTVPSATTLLSQVDAALRRQVLRDFPSQVFVWTVGK
jgi:hypothetical protein